MSLYLPGSEEFEALRRETRQAEGRAFAAVEEQVQFVVDALKAWSPGRRQRHAAIDYAAICGTYRARRRSSCTSSEAGRANSIWFASTVTAPAARSHASRRLRAHTVATRTISGPVLGWFAVFQPRRNTAYSVSRGMRSPGLARCARARCPCRASLSRDDHPTRTSSWSRRRTASSP